MLPADLRGLARIEEGEIGLCFVAIELIKLSRYPALVLK
jgi:hypothetical protein